MNKGKRGMLIGFILLVLLLTFFVGTPTAPVSAVPPPLLISVSPKKVYIAPPHCKASFLVTVSSYFEGDHRISIMFDEWSEGDWLEATGQSFPPTEGIYQPLFSSVFLNNVPTDHDSTVASNSTTVVTCAIAAPWEIPAGEYKVRVFALPVYEGIIARDDVAIDPSTQIQIYDIVTVVIVDTGVKYCNEDYWPPPPTDEDSEIITERDEDSLPPDDTPDIIIDTKDGWPPPDDHADIITDRKDHWRWWRWWRYDWRWWRWWRYNEQTWWDSWWYRWWPWINVESKETKLALDFNLTVTPSFQTAEPGESAYYAVNVGHLSGDAQPVSLSATGLPAGVISSFSVSSAQPSFSSSLSITTEPALPPGTYPFTVTGSGGGKTHSVSADLVVDEGRGKTTLLVSVNPTATQIDESVLVSGALSPPLAAPIELIYTRPDGFEMTKPVTTSPEGTFSDSFASDLAGLWSIRARWDGDEEYFGSESQPAGLSVEAAPEQPSAWEMFFGILTLIIFIAFIITLIYLLVRRIRRSKAGNPIQAAAGVKYCMQCGASIPEGAKFCSQCGSKA